MVVLLGHGEDQSGRLTVGRPGVGRRRHEVGVDADGAHHHHAVAQGGGRRRLAQVEPLNRVGDRFELHPCESDELGMVDDDRPQPPLDRQLVGGVGAGVGPAVLPHDGHRLG